MREQVKDYYGKTLSQSSDLKTDACCTLVKPPEYIQSILKQLHEEVTSRYYGCGLVAPELLKGLRVLDLGSGSGHDVYLLSALVGEHGHVTGVDMTEEQLEVAGRHIDYHTRQFGYATANVDFHLGYIEQLDKLGFADNSFDLVISNCVINLSPDKASVLREAWRLLKPGGEMYFSDVYSDRRIPEELASDEVLYGECLGGALYWKDFLQLAKDCGFADPRLVEDRPLTISNPAVEALIGHINFFSATYRLFKVEGQEASAEDYGQSVIYKGTIEQQPEAFRFDKRYNFTRGEQQPVCANTFRLLQNSRFRDHFDFIGDRQVHHGPFSGSNELPFTNTRSESQADTGRTGCC